MKLIRSVLFALLMSLLFGLAVGTWLRLQLERPVRYLGMSELVGEPCRDASIILLATYHETQLANSAANNATG